MQKGNCWFNVTFKDKNTVSLLIKESKQRETVNCGDKAINNYLLTTTNTSVRK